jgi:hypothetical protein
MELQGLIEKNDLIGTLSIAYIYALLGFAYRKSSFIQKEAQGCRPLHDSASPSGTSPELSLNRIFFLEFQCFSKSFLPEKKESPCGWIGECFSLITPPT